jgi:hypothetical protein
LNNIRTVNGVNTSWIITWTGAFRDEGQDVMVSIRNVRRLMCGMLGPYLVAVFWEVTDILGSRV